MDWIKWEEHPVPKDVRGILIKYSDGKIFSDRYNEDGSRKFYENSTPMEWKFMERTSPDQKSVQCLVCL
jgi:hypothetical protein